MSYLFSFLIILTSYSFATASELEYRPIEKMKPPRVQLVDIDNEGKLYYRFRDGGLKLNIIEKEERLEKSSPKILDALEISYDSSDDTWISLANTEYKMDNLKEN